MAQNAPVLSSSVLICTYQHQADVKLVDGLSPLQKPKDADQLREVKAQLEEQLKIQRAAAAQVKRLTATPGECSLSCT